MWPPSKTKTSPLPIQEGLETVATARSATPTTGNQPKSLSFCWSIRGRDGNAGKRGLARKDNGVDSNRVWSESSTMKGVRRQGFLQRIWTIGSEATTNDGTTWTTIGETSRSRATAKKRVRDVLLPFRSPRCSDHGLFRQLVT